jgi:thiamine-phosphate pyrophosphorylase
VSARAGLRDRGGIVCLVSDRRVMTIDRFRAAVRAGVDLIQIRERDLEGARLAELARAVVEVARGSQTLVVVNDRVDVALAAGADGVHLRSDSFDAPAVRALAGGAFVVGRSVHSNEEAARHGGGEADYLMFGTVFASASKAPGHRVAGPGGLAAACAQSAVPVLAIGGITIERAAEAAAAGARGVAGIGVFAGARDLEETVRRLRAAFTDATGPGR